MPAPEVVDVEEAGAYTKIVTDEEAEGPLLLEQADAATAAVVRRRTPWRLAAAGAAGALLVLAAVYGLRTPPARKQQRRHDCEGGSCQAGTSSLDATLMLKTGPPIDSSITCPSGYVLSTANLKGPKTTSMDTIDDCAAKCSAEATCPGFEFGGQMEGDDKMECYVFDEDHVSYGEQKQQFITCLKPQDFKPGPQAKEEAPASEEEEKEEEEEEEEAPETGEAQEESEGCKSWCEEKGEMKGSCDWPECADCASCPEKAEAPEEGEAGEVDQSTDIDGCMSWCEEKGDWSIVCEWPDCLACASCSEEAEANATIKENATVEEEAVPGDEDASEIVTATEEPEGSEGCKSWCETSDESWENRCKWPECSDCGQCEEDEVTGTEEPEDALVERLLGGSH